MAPPITRTEMMSRLSSRVWHRGVWSGAATGLAWVLAVLCVLLFALPLLALVVHQSPGTVLSALLRPRVIEALQLSALTTTIATVAAVVLGIPVAYLLARRKLPFSSAIATLLTLPTVLPPVVAGVALLVAFGRRGLLGQYLLLAGISIPFTTVAVILAQLFVAGPFFISAARAAFENLDPAYEEAAMTLRATALARTLLVAIPLTAPQLVVGASLTWARALGEFGATITFAGNLPGVTQTLPITTYLTAQNDLDTAVAISVVLLVVSGVLLGAGGGGGGSLWRPR